MARSQPGQKSLVCRAQGGCGKVPGQELKEGQSLKLPFFITGETPDILAVLMAGEHRIPPQMAKGYVASFPVGESPLAAWLWQETGDKGCAGSSLLHLQPGIL